MAKEIRKDFPAETVEFLNEVDDNIKQMHLKVDFRNGLAKSEILYKNKAIGKSIFASTAKRLAGRGKFYIDLKSLDIYNETKHNYGTILIHSNLNKIKWKHQDSTKIINGYQCNYAFANYSTRNEKYNEGTRKIHAWYTTEIPIELGPLDFGNLPGLILELEALEFLYTLDSIEFQSDPIGNITIPDSIRVIEEEDYLEELRVKFGRE